MFCFTFYKHNRVFFKNSLGNFHKKVNGGIEGSLLGEFVCMCMCL